MYCPYDPDCRLFVSSLVFTLGLAPPSPNLFLISYFWFWLTTSLDRVGRRGDGRDDSAETLFQSFRRQATVSSSGSDRGIHCLKSSSQHFLCRLKYASTQSLNISSLLVGCLGLCWFIPRGSKQVENDVVSCLSPGGCTKRNKRLKTTRRLLFVIKGFYQRTKRG